MPLDMTSVFSCLGGSEYIISCRWHNCIKLGGKVFEILYIERRIHVDGKWSGVRSH